MKREIYWCNVTLNNPALPNFDFWLQSFKFNYRKFGPSTLDQLWVIVKTLRNVLVKNGDLFNTFWLKKGIEILVLFQDLGKKIWRLRYFADEMNHNSVIINDKSGCSRITDHLFSCSLHRQVMGLRGGIGCLLALFAGLVWLECSVSTAYFRHCSLEISLCIINTRQRINLVAEQVVFRWLVVLFLLDPQPWIQELNGGFTHKTARMQDVFFLPNVLTKLCLQKYIDCNEANGPCILTSSLTDLAVRKSGP